MGRLTTGKSLRFWIASFLVVLFVFEVYRVYSFYDDLTESKASLTSLKDDLDLARLQDSADNIEAKQKRLSDAKGRLSDAKGFMGNDPFVLIAGEIPGLKKQVNGLETAVRAGEVASDTGMKASDVALAYARFERDPKKTSIEQSIDFLRSQEGPMSEVEAGMLRLRQAEAEMPDGLIGPLGNAKRDLASALDRLDSLVEGYKRADTLLPGLLGYDGQKKYLLLAQNDTELFPSGGLISSYGIVTFEKGKLLSMELEYFGTLYDRWQRRSDGEYIEPPASLKAHLLRSFSWALGEAGWYPDFPTTVGYSRDFVAKGGVAPTEGVIAIDLQFTQALLDVLGSVRVPEYNVTVTPQNFNEVTLEETRDENYQPGQPKKAFLSYLSQAMLKQIYTLPQDRWIDLLKFFDRMGKERHLQIYFDDTKLQSLSEAYGFDGRIIQPEDGDFLLIADASVKSTKLNLILKPSAKVEVQLSANGTAKTDVLYEIDNPFPEWAKGKNPALVELLMYSGIYGCYLRVFVPEQSTLDEIKLNGGPGGAEEIAKELGKAVFGRFFPVPPGESANIEVQYETPGVVTKGDDGLYHYKLYVQKEAGTRATPFTLTPQLPQGAELVQLRLDGQRVRGSTIETDLRVDREIEVVFRLG
ncbi:MAG TPA: DUF4012 domain-containing protein [Dehalococcoidia bacterium]|nr:DUF4012 domain-containing protein [Dehalococcoidia bacterium]